MSEIKLTIDGRELTASAGETILAVARRAGIEIPTLCHDDSLKPYGACGMCVVAMEGSPRLFRACATEAAEGQVIYTNTEAVRSARCCFPTTRAIARLLVSWLARRAVIARATLG